MAAANKTGTTVFTTPSDQEVASTRVFDAPRQLVWAAWTSPDHLPHWMLGPDGWTMTVCEIDLRPGGPYRYVWQQADGTQMQISGAYLEVAAPERLVATETWGDPFPETLNTLLLTEHGGTTTATVTVRYPSKEARDTALGTGMREGMSESYNRLDQLLATRA